MNKDRSGTNREGPELFEGDIIPSIPQIEEQYENGHELVQELVEKHVLLEEGDEEKRTRARDLALTDDHSKLWTGRDGDVVTVPYVFKSNKFTSKEKKKITDALDDLSVRNGVVKFVLRTNQKEHINIVRDSGCGWSYVGHVREKQDLMLNCIKWGTIQHEFMHAVGFWHEQSRHDRDKYVTINYKNIDGSNKHNFETRKTNSLESGYDYESVMHYSEKAFSKNGKTTIDAKGHDIGQRVGASTEDLLQLRLMYQCKTGPRLKTDYDKNPCTRDCPCWKNHGPCKGQNHFCPC